MNKATKIVATIGPATETETTIEQLIYAGMNVARFNTKHGTTEWHKERIQRVRNISKRMQVPIGILLDLQGPEVRLTIPGGKSFPVENNQLVVFTSDEKSQDPHSPIIPQIVIDSLTKQNTVLIDDGIGEFIIADKSENSLTLRALGNFTVANRKTVNTPGAVLNMPSLIPQDLEHLDGMTDQLIDYVGLSFVRDANDIHHLRSELKKRNLHPHIIAKIENQVALDNLDEIIVSADAIMVARGDLAVEVPFQELSYWQKHIIHKSREAGKPVITATQMLKSMVEQSRPTRAEVSDVANAVYDGTDAVMLSEETTIGKFPVEAVTAQAIIVEFNEKHAEPKKISTVDDQPSSYVTHSAVLLLNAENKKPGQLFVDKIICLTETGSTARLLSRFRPSVPIHALTSNEQTYNKLSLLYNVTAHIIYIPQGNLLDTNAIVEQIKSLSLAKSGETILLLHGTFWKQPGLTNTLAVLRIP